MRTKTPRHGDLQQKDSGQRRPAAQAATPPDSAAHARFGHSMGQVRFGEGRVGEETLPIQRQPDDATYNLINAPQQLGGLPGPSLMTGAAGEQMMNSDAADVNTIQPQMNADNQGSALDRWQMTQGAQPQAPDTQQDVTTDRAAAGHRAAKAVEEYTGG